MIKAFLLSATFTIISVCSTISFAYNSDAKKEFLLDIKEETKKCAVQLIEIKGDTQVVAGYESSCDSLKILSDTAAQVYVDSEWLSVVVKESQESDDGDLDDLSVYNSKGQLVATHSNVAAYDSVVVAMAPGIHFKQKIK